MTDDPKVPGSNPGGFRKEVRKSKQEVPLSEPIPLSFRFKYLKLTDIISLYLGNKME